ncbi:MAG: response regulator transcription factor [Anaerolineae bacterium]|nr:response regulator transcription factor [Anaerolineae bacterium]
MAKPITIFLVDQHALSRSGLQKVLTEESDFEIVGATGQPDEVLDCVKTLTPDVLLIDATLPQVDVLIRHLIAYKPALKILALALDCDVQQAISLLSTGATGYLCKQIAPPNLIHAMRQVHRGETVLSPRAARGVVDQLMQSGSGSPNNELHDLLTEREIEVLQLLCQGLPDKEIGQKLNISPRTVNGHLSHIYAKLDVHSRTETMILALEKGWVSLE